MNAPDETRTAPFVWCLFHGRLGNHLFQYAAARTLCPSGRILLDFSKTGVALTRRSVAAYDFMRLGLPGVVLPPLFNRVVHRLTGRHCHEWNLFGRMRDADWQSGTPARSPMILDGYFQTAAVADGVPGDFRGLLLARLGAVSGLKPGALDDGVVAVHVRRGDYLPHDARVVCDEGYFRAAMKRMRETVRPSGFLIFSDDPAWCREKLSAPDVEFASSALERDALAALHRMALCRHQIISNSTFSWWAGWLNPHADKMVIGPDRWSSDGVEEIESRIFPGFQPLDRL